MDAPVTISELTRSIKQIIESEFKFVFATGEISNFKHHSSGHFYFVLKDGNAQISAIMWNSRNILLNFKPSDGQQVIVKGRITLYETRGAYQIDIFEMIPAGAGSLQIKFEQLKQKLKDEGLFDSVYKKEIVKFPKRVGLITSDTGAALEDFKRITKRRYPFVNLLLFPALMQGAGSAESVCNAIRLSNNKKYELDAVVITRGGGSLEDLWTFNEESVARAVFESEVPVVSAIGHEVDFTICDFVADVRASTPTAAAEIIFPDKNELLETVKRFQYNIKSLVTGRMDDMKSSVDYIENNYFFKKPADILKEYKLNVDDFMQKFERIISLKIKDVNNHLNFAEKMLANVSPEQTLKRGFVYVKRDDKIISRKKSLSKDDKIDVIFYDGETKAIITK